jgi:hypothetical protein
MTIIPICSDNNAQERELAVPVGEIWIKKAGGLTDASPTTT